MKFPRYGGVAIPVVSGLMILWFVIFLSSSNSGDSGMAEEPSFNDSGSYFELMTATWGVAWSSASELQNANLCSLVTENPEEFLSLSGIPLDLPDFVSVSEYQVEVLAFLNGRCSTLESSE